MSQYWRVTYEFMPRPTARAEAWVYTIENQGGYWGTLVDERIRYKTLFEPKSDIHDDLDEIIVPIDARYWVRVGQWSRTLVPGEIALIPRGTSHDSGTASNLIGTRFLVLLFNPRLKVLSDEGGGITLPQGTLSWLKGAIRFLRMTPDQHGLLPLTILPEFLRTLVARGEKLDADQSHADPLVMNMTRILEQADSISLEELGAAVGLSPFHAQKRFRSAYGCTPLQYARAWKLDEIAKQIRAGNSLPLIELATEHGFEDMKHFRTLFKHRFGVSPSAYRKNAPPKN